ncbi:hypothetical protein DET54_102231 [Paenibacillus pabuli]|uniref:Uncharacterized protein n=1 Tax=Paenibacillus pabuli TaxID=1472 RepID=A0ABX9BPS2_9BACL|nr:hypothetical protein DET54_102231 [Paenibacillus pabuli]
MNWFCVVALIRKKRLVDNNTKKNVNPKKRSNWKARSFNWGACSMCERDLAESKQNLCIKQDTWSQERIEVTDDKTEQIGGRPH